MRSPLGIVGFVFLVMVSALWVKTQPRALGFLSSMGS